MNMGEARDYQLLLRALGQPDHADMGPALDACGRLYVRSVTQTGTGLPTDTLIAADRHLREHLTQGRRRARHR